MCILLYYLHIAMYLSKQLFFSQNLLLLEDFYFLLEEKVFIVFCHTTLGYKSHREEIIYMVKNSAKHYTCISLPLGKARSIYLGKTLEKRNRLIHFIVYHYYLCCTILESTATLPVRFFISYTPWLETNVSICSWHMEIQSTKVSLQWNLILLKFANWVPWSKKNGEEEWILIGQFSSSMTS